MEKTINSTDFSAQLAMPEWWGNRGFPPLTLKPLEPAVICRVKAIAVTADIRYSWSPSQMPSFTDHDSHLVKWTCAKSPFQSRLLASPCDRPARMGSRFHLTRWPKNISAAFHCWLVVTIPFSTSGPLLSQAVQRTACLWQAGVRKFRVLEELMSGWDGCSGHKQRFSRFFRYAKQGPKEFNRISSYMSVTLAQSKKTWDGCLFRSLVYIKSAKGPIIRVCSCSWKCANTSAFTQPCFHVRCFKCNHLKTALLDTLFFLYGPSFKRGKFGYSMLFLQQPPDLAEVLPHFAFFTTAPFAVALRASERSRVSMGPTFT